ncbi:hypothetical protein SAMN05421796_102263 [Chryseobacterium piscicola]|jgi:hypothetical protein|uniref:Uncharacterized protein n=1 Tax=Chryseobacterium piscicola TaxID=551459 RepID=A0A1N7LEU5_9FLAO|nr:hypothetical protein [Chryseobacterium piscicola]PQA97575.1 hypothetical protein B0A70_02630 [Chryseobacterium piscicola]SIS72342.1 hypothetical protein SAMN05421796_102263 [Chryseobacterium piscicola]
MKKILYSLFLFASVSVFAQKDLSTKFAIADGNVGTVAMFEARKAWVQSINVLKNPAALTEDLKKYSFLAENGLATVKFKKSYGTLDFISLNSLNKQSGISPETPVFIDGYEFTDTKINIFADLMAKSEIKDYNGKKTLFITSIKK